MPDPDEVLRALDILVEQYGDEVDHYVNFDHLMNSESLVEIVRPIIEDRISETYLPGFKFEDNYHAAWFLKKYSSWPTWFTNYPMKPEYWDDNWVRMIMMPNKHHYIAEVASALQRYDQQTAGTIREFEKIKEEGDEKKIHRAAKQIHIARMLGGLPPGPLKGERDLMAMQSWRLRLLDKFADFDLPNYDTSIMRLAKNVTDYRTVREGASPPCGWRISQVTHIGNVPNPSAEDQQEWEGFTHSYFERWEWHPIDGGTPPSRTELSFREPADPGLWQRKWKKNMRRFRA